MYYQTGSSSFTNSYGSANKLDIWNQNNGYTPAEVAGYGGISGVSGVGELSMSGGGLAGIADFIAGTGTGTLLVVGGLLLFALSSTWGEKRSKKQQARERYKKELAAIDSEYGRFGLKKYGRK